uniref:Putative secreted protein n=1 Tax=Anopheles darlingi TaxID=43151 RepID=A0A2M4DH70_ANODA
MHCASCFCLLMMIEEVLKCAPKPSPPYTGLRGAFVACIVLSKEMEIFHFSDLLTRAAFWYANFGNARKEGEGNTLRSILEDDPRTRGCGIELSFSHSQPILQYSSTVSRALNSLTRITPLLNIILNLSGV